MNQKKINVILIVLGLSFSSNIIAQEKSAEELAKMSQNPLANMMSSFKKCYGLWNETTI